MMHSKHHLSEIRLNVLCRSSDLKMYVGFQL